jgi:SulP family sulfate permease
VTATRKARSAGVTRSALVGVVFGVDAVGHCLALATICFAGALSAGLGLATMVFLLATGVATLALALRGGLPVSLALAQDTTIAILAPAVALAAAAAPATDAARVGTALAVIGCSALLSGLTFWLVGRFRLGHLIRMFPFPVAAGFLASSGYLLVFYAISIVARPDGAAAASTVEVLVRLLPLLAMTAAFHAAMRVLGGSAGVIVVVGAGIVLFHGGLWVSGLGTAEAVARHWLPEVPAGGGVIGPGILAAIDWGAVAATAPALAAVVLLNLIGVLLNTTGVELATGARVDVDRELRVTGGANLLIGLFGGLTSYLQAGANIMAARLGVDPRAFTLAHMAVVLGAAVLAGPIVAAVPVFVAAALLMLIGTTLLWDWLVATYWRLVLADWLVVLGIVGLTAAAGIMPAIVAGLLLAMGNFVLGYIRLPLVRHATDGARRSSALDRGPAERAILMEYGQRIHILHLQGALFFGSVEQLGRRLSDLQRDVPGLCAVILDLRGVNTFDSSACSGLTRLAQMLDGSPVTVWLTGVSGAQQQVIDRWGLDLSGRDRSGGLRQAATLDDALEAAEDALLDGSLLRTGDVTLSDLIGHLSDNHPRHADLLARLEPVALETGETLMAAGDAARDIYILECGRLGVFVDDGRAGQARVRSVGPGAVLGEMAYLTGAARGADVRAEAPSLVHRLSGAALDDLRHTDPDLAALFAFMLGRALSIKLAQSHEQARGLR